jgi:hypothetical protein
MNCSELELVLEQNGLEPLPDAVRAHVAGCSDCKNLVGDFMAIVRAAEKLPAEVDPPEQLWVSLRAQLAAEGIIREPVVHEKASWWESLGAFLRPRTLATAAVGFLIIAAGALQLWRTQGPIKGVPPAYAETVALLDTQEKDVANMVLASASASPVDISLRDNLQIVDKFIADCEQRVRQMPDDEVAREYLSGAYQQKADLLSAMMERNGGGD